MELSYYIAQCLSIKIYIWIGVVSPWLTVAADIIIAVSNIVADQVWLVKVVAYFIVSVDDGVGVRNSCLLVVVSVAKQEVVHKHQVRRNHGGRNTRHHLYDHYQPSHKWCTLPSTIPDTIVWILVKTPL